MDVWEVAGLVLGGIAVGFSASYPVGYLRERGRQRAVRDGESRDRRRQARAERERQAAEAALRDREDQARRDRIDALRKERVGARFLRRYAPDDIGFIVTVVELGDRDPENWVVITEVPRAGRTPTEFDPPQQVERVSIEWRALTESPAAQRHRTARSIELSTDDRDGWLVFEPLGRAEIA